MRKMILVLALVAIAAAPALADRSMVGGTCTVLSPAFLVPETVNVIEFAVLNGSTDTEWTSWVDFTFHDCFEITGGWFDATGISGPGNFGFSWTGQVATFMDADGGYGEMYGGDTVLFYVEVIPHCECGDYLVHWFQQGDIWGADPHFVEGDVTVTVCDVTATQDSSWTSLKSLY